MKNNQVERLLKLTAAQQQKTGHFVLIDLVTNEAFLLVAEEQKRHFRSLSLLKEYGRI